MNPTTALNVSEYIPPPRVEWTAPAAPAPAARPAPQARAEPRRRKPGLVTIILPAKDEEAAIVATLRSLPRSTLHAMGYTTEVFVLDGNSRDSTRRLAREWGATVIRDTEPGKANAVRNALPLFNGDFTVMLDGDGTYAADVLPALLEPLARGRADVVMGLRRPLARAMPWSHRAGNAGLSAAASLLYVRRTRDVCTGLWAFRTAALRRLPLRSRRFGLEAELFAWSARLGLRMAEVEVDYLPRQGGPPKLHSLRDGFRIARRLVQARVGARRPRTASARNAMAVAASEALDFTPRESRP